MFLPGRRVLEANTSSLNYNNARDGLSSPLAKRLFRIDGVTGVFFSGEYVTVTKSESWDWAVLKPEVFAAIMDHFASNEPVVYDEATLSSSDNVILDTDSEVVAMIKELLETRIRPAVAEDGGDIVYKGYDTESGIVSIKMQGSCSGCPSSSVTLKSGVENMLMHYISDVKGVVEVEENEPARGGTSC